jgi:hypothetical protein
MAHGCPVFVNKGNALAEAFRVSSSQPIRDCFTFMAGIAQYRLGKMVRGSSE